jgi:hypothetical protein
MLYNSPKKQRRWKKEQTLKVEGLHSGSFSHTLHEFIQFYGGDEFGVENAVICYTKKRPDGGITIIRNFFGEPVVCYGLLDFLKTYIDDWAEYGGNSPPP